MSLFLETIKINNGRRMNLAGHSARMNITRNRHFHEIRNIDLENEIEVPEAFRDGVVKCRVVYARGIERVEYEHYSFSNPRTFRLMNADHISYAYKYEDRTELKKLYDMRGGTDDIIMVKEGLITDSFYANVALLKNGTWYTPSKPLLQGTFREKLVMNETLVCADIRADEIFNYERVKLVNAMLEWSGHQDVLMNENLVYNL